MTIVLVSGGTGGHLIPAITLGEHLAKSKKVLLLTRAKDLVSPMLAQISFSAEAIASAPFLGKNPWAIMRALFLLLKGTWQSFQILKRVGAEVVVGFGAYVSVPVILAAACLRIPVILHEQNPVPGKANAWLSYLAKKVAVSFESSKKYFGSKSVWTGNFLRPQIYSSAVSAEEARQTFGLTKERKTLLVFGGSLGARTINLWLERAVSAWPINNLQILHISGNAEESLRLKKVYQQAGIPFCVKDFESEMGLAYRAADLAVARAGATTVYELVATQTPAILIPYPHAANHQLANARLLSDKKAAVVIQEDASGFKKFQEIVPNLLFGSTEALQMRQRLSQLQWPVESACSRMVRCIAGGNDENSIGTN